METSEAKLLMKLTQKVGELDNKLNRLETKLAEHSVTGIKILIEADEKALETFMEKIRRNF